MKENPPNEIQAQQAPASEAAQMDLKEIEGRLADFSQILAGLCPGETPDLGALIMTLEHLSEAAKKSQNATFSKVVASCLSYVTGISLETEDRVKPVEDARILMEAIIRHMKKGMEFTFDTEDVMAILNATMDPDTSQEPEAPREAAAPAQNHAPEADDDIPSPSGVPLSSEDIEIMVDFVTEAEENLDAIEVHLIELEQDPTDSEIINNIFRPFHSIKGVAGFLSLTKINHLAHSTENLLDSARSGEFIINPAVTDAILESVDTLKQLISRVKQGAQQGVSVPDDDIPISDLRNRLDQLLQQLTSGEAEPLGTILVNKGVLEQDELEASLEKQKEAPEKKIGELLVEDQKVKPVEVAQALAEQRQEKKKVVTQVKVNTEKLDDLVDYAGELVIAQSMLRQLTSDDAELNQSVAQLGQIVSNMQHIAMSMRMIPIKSTFMKMIRLVRDLSKKSGKNVALEMSGEETEIDRNVVDALYEPMVHMIRNSVDHGMETPDERSRTEKPATGIIHLKASHKGGQILIEIQDDGRGLDRERILTKGIEAGLVSEEDSLTDAQVFDLILQPGFSTAQTVTDVSGRGVGMDVVKSSIEKFRGHLKIDSEKGKGTRFTIGLPLTLAIIDGMLVRVGEQRYVIPTTVIQRAFKPEESNCVTVEGKGELIKERDRLIPLIRLNQLYDHRAEATPPWESLAVVVESKDEQKALLIDELLGKDEYVIKSLGGNLENVKGFAGGAILADGRVGLILDIHGVFTLAKEG